MADVNAVSVFSAAAARCRNKKKYWMTCLEQKADSMAMANTALQVAH